MAISPAPPRKVTFPSLLRRPTRVVRGQELPRVACQHFLGHKSEVTLTGSGGVEESAIGGVATAHVAAVLGQDPMEYFQTRQEVCSLPRFGALPERGMRVPLAGEPHPSDARFESDVVAVAVHGGQLNRRRENPAAPFPTGAARRFRDGWWRHSETAVSRIGRPRIP